ncbi:MAG: methyltransferase domain-containing protein [Flavobacteriales bacterium]|nr:MAG: methyltransferase domain-containing protein [Flavobacteriales bacterium]
MLCPECEALLSAEWTCPNGHAWPLVDGVRRCVNAELSRTLDPFLDAFQDHRAVRDERILEPALFPRLPEAGVEHDPALWKLRMYDLDLIKRLLSDRAPSGGLRILDVGAWNGWLSHRLSAMGHHVTATDVFIDAHDGLGAVRHYPHKFLAVQADQERLHLFEGPFDLVVAQRCAGYFVDLARSIQQLQALVAPGGVLLFTGVNVYHDPRTIRKQLAQEARHFAERYHLPYFFKPVKGFVDEDDAHLMERHGIELRSYPQLRLKNWLSRPLARKPQYQYGIWTAVRNGA